MARPPKGALVPTLQQAPLSQKLEPAGQTLPQEPQLARSLAVLGNCLEAADRLETALEADCETVALLTVDLTRWPQAYAGLMGAVCRGYLRRCEKAGVEPDEALLAPVIAVFERLQGGNAEEQATAEE